jgi:hypothetical protein
VKIVKKDILFRLASASAKKENSNAPNVGAEKARLFWEIFTPRRLKRVKIFQSSQGGARFNFHPGIAS